MNPPIKGPKTGPINGQAESSAMGLSNKTVSVSASVMVVRQYNHTYGPTSTLVNMSLADPPTMERNALPAKPVMNRNIKCMAVKIKTKSAKSSQNNCRPTVPTDMLGKCHGNVEQEKDEITDDIDLRGSTVSMSENASDDDDVGQSMQSHLSSTNEFTDRSQEKRSSTQSKDKTSDRQDGDDLTDTKFLSKSRIG